MSQPCGITLRELLENPNLLHPPKLNNDLKTKGDDSDLTYDFTSAFLGPVLWDKTLPFGEDDFKLESLDLDDFLAENSETTLPQSPALQQNVQPIQPSPPLQIQQQPHQLVVPPSPQSSCSLSPSPTVDFHVDEQDLALATIPGIISDVPGQNGFDPRKRAFSEEELKPQPMIKKSKKIYVPDDLKDNKYWSRRNKNNVAAKRSRDARRVKENQIAMRAAFLEKQNDNLREEMDKVRLENKSLKARLSQYEPSQ